MRVHCINSQLLYQPDELFEPYLFFLHRPLIFFLAQGDRELNDIEKWTPPKKFGRVERSDKKATLNILHFFVLSIGDNDDAEMILLVGDLFLA